MLGVVLPSIQVAGGAKVGHLRLLVTAEDVRLDPEASADRVGELRAVGRVADSARHHGDYAVDRRRVERGAVLGQGGVLPLQRVVGEPAARVDPGAEPGHGADPRDLVRDAAVVDLGNVEPRRVGPNVDYGDSHCCGPDPDANLAQMPVCAGTW